MAFAALNIYTTLIAYCAWTLLSIHFVLSAEESSYRSAHFSLQKNRYLPNYVIHTKMVTSYIDCSMLCLARDDCQSWNMVKTSSRYTCELNNVTMETAAQDNTYLMVKEGAQFGQMISIATPKKTITYLFTSLGAEGKDGPSTVTQYAGTSLEGKVMLDNGLQKWIVQQTGTYRIESRGASGANGTCTRDDRASSWHLGGLGARIKGTFNLQKGTMLNILVGQSGITNAHFGDRPGGGGGGSFVTLGDNTPLIIAGGGGGGGGCIVTQGVGDGDTGQTGVLGSRCNSTLKQGGLLCSDVSLYTPFAGAGAGLLGNGKGMTRNIGSYGFVNGGAGGTIHVNSFGGFGGGGYGFLFGGGGGGYSGGGVLGNSTSGVAGGGGSFNSGGESDAGICESGGDGLVKIDLIG